MGLSLSTTLVPNWQDACKAAFNCTSNGLVDISGKVTSATCAVNGSIVADGRVWGITAQACYTNCGSDMLRQSIEFSPSAITIATWLLPWIALIAQLPFEANGWLDLLSAGLCVGSPMLAAYSLALTALNRRYIARQLQRLKSTAERDTRPEYSYITDRADAAAFILQEAQQGPLRANQNTGELASLIVLNDRPRQNFWKTAVKDLKNTRRGFTYSFLAQVLLATVWSWMFPIVFGYIRVGSQCKAGAIKEALMDNMIAECDTSGEIQPVCQRGLIPSADLDVPWMSPDPLTPTGPPAATQIPMHNTSIPAVGALDRARPDAAFNLSDKEEFSHESQPQMPPRHLNRPLPPPMWCGFDVRGDERREGPIFNYARIFSWFTCVQNVGGGFETAIESFRVKAPIPLTAVDAAHCCGWSPRQHLTAFAPWSKLPTAFRHMFGAACVALLLQWGTTGAAIFVAYSTPPVGLGCRSGSYVLYGIAATVSCALLVLASLFSHAVMQRVEKNTRRRSAGFLGALAVIARVTGQVIAIVNAGWLIASTVMEDIGAFENCWCQSNALQYGANGWTPVFAATSDLRAAAGGIWIGGFIFSMVVCLLVGLFFAYE
ncbi:hypothetical protein MVEN_01289600 [Mycena venus]|uniref:Transmembrane protein n=1 Tax=Mycena venus TaxID=2733690 RepID=A0A8H6XX63_9AGAR|nr:hypothetical protein MVEN_01289600 [Mycena venus]